MFVFGKTGEAAAITLAPSKYIHAKSILFSGL